MSSRKIRARADAHARLPQLERAIARYKKHIERSEQSMAKAEEQLSETRGSLENLRRMGLSSLIKCRAISAKLAEEAVKVVPLHDGTARSNGDGLLIEAISSLQNMDIFLSSFLESGMDLPDGLAEYSCVFATSRRMLGGIKMGLWQVEEGELAFSTRRRGMAGLERSYALFEKSMARIRRRAASFCEGTTAFLEGVPQRMNEVVEGLAIAEHEILPQLSQSKPAGEAPPTWESGQRGDPRGN